MAEHPELLPYGIIREDLFRPLSRAGARWFITAAICLITVLAGLAAWGVQLREGLGVTGLNRPVFWGLYIVDFVFWIGISHAGTLISAILRLTEALEEHEDVQNVFSNFDIDEKEMEALA